MTNQEEVKILVAEWTAQGWTMEEIEASLVAYFEDSPCFVDDDAEAD